VTKLEAYTILRNNWLSCTRCKFHTGRKQVVLGAGSLDSGIMLIGQWPGKDEDIKGIPVQGEAGKYVNSALQQAMIPWDSVFFDNILGCHPGETKPKNEEKNICWERLSKTIEVVAPRVIILCGAEASKFLYDKPIAGSKLAGTFWERNGITWYSTTHPGEVARMKSPDAKSASWTRICTEYKILGTKVRELGLLGRVES
jgi:uracil-DNA glycosylase